MAFVGVVLQVEKYLSLFVCIAFFPSSHCRAGVLFFLTIDQCFSSVSAVELLVVEKKLFM